MSLATVILAAGKGTRMQSDLPKVLHPIAHAPMLHHVMHAAADLSPDRNIVVAGHGSDLVSDAAHQIDPTCQVVLQTQQLGTGHAVDQARAALSDFSGIVLVLYGDSPLFQTSTLQALVDKLNDVDVAILGFDAKDPARYGRLITTGDALDRIVEFKDANDEERAITLCNSGVMAAKSDLLFDLLSKLENKNASGEYYLTDVIEHARTAGKTAAVVICAEDETLGVNSRVELAQAEAHFQSRRRRAALENGVTLPAPDTVFFAFDTVLGRDVMVEANVIFGPGVTIENNATIRAFSHLEGAHVADGCVVGPYARLRPGAELGPDVKIGNFVEVKAAEIAEGAKVNHLSYVGDAQIGKHTNIGAGTITCNYDGVLKHKTIIGENAFIGSNTMLVAPVHIGDEAMTGSGSVITKDVPDQALALARAEQINKDGFAKRLMDRLRAIKAKKKDS